MLILHAGFARDRLMIWGERPIDSEPARNRKRPTRNRFPFDPGGKGLLAALGEAVPGLGKPPAADEATLWLPTISGQPIPSSPLVAQPPATGKSTLAPWPITVLPLGPAQTLELLSACVGRETLAPGIIVGKTLAYWSTAFRLAGELTARERFLPTLAHQEDRWEARWDPVLDVEDQRRLGQLAQSMPPACRALSATADAPPAEPAADTLHAFVRFVVDALVRGAVEPTAPPPAGGGRKRKPAARFDSIHEHWLHQLQSSEPVLAGIAAEARQLAGQIEDWRRPVRVAAETPFRLCFRLEEPKAEPAIRMGRSDSWHLRYLLQGVEDPSLLVPAAEAWQPRGRIAAILQRGSFRPREYLLSSLGQAAAIDPGIEKSLQSAAPAGCDLDLHAAHQFLTEKSWLLEQAGFGVLLPAWWTRKGTKLRLSVRAHVTSPRLKDGAGMSLDEIVQFDWQVALGGELLSQKELEALARLKAPLVQVRGQWVQVNADEIRAALAFWKKQGSQPASVRQVVQMALGAGTPPGGLELDGVSASGWVNDLLSQLEGKARFEELAAPQRFQGTLRPYQVRGYSWLGFLRRWGLGACLADDMGLGKTVQTLALVQRDWESNGRRPTLLICPMSVVGNWHKEAARFTPDLPVLVHHGSQRQRDSAFVQAAGKHALVLSSYALLHRDFELLREVPWKGIILDEAQNIKNAETKQARAARGLPADYRIALTGTPVENHVGDLWSIMDFLNPGLLGTQAEFRRRFFVPIQAGRDPQASARLKHLTGPFILRRLKTDKSIIADLPDKLEMKVYCNLTREQASLYAAVVEDANRALEKTDEGIQRKGLILATLSKLKQVCNHPAQFLGDNSAIAGRSGKLARLTEMLEEALSTRDKALVFTQFSEMGALIKRHLEETFGREVLYLHGSVPKKRRDQMVERFQQADDCDAPRVFVLSLKAGGTGLNLTAANHVFHFDRWWNPAVENQATDRAFRIGQKRNVQVHKFLCVGTLEEKIDEMIERKQEVANRVVGVGEAWLTELSNQELRELFALRDEALGE
jgi:SNF2 family DNA or RNA helicase